MINHILGMLIDLTDLTVLGPRGSRKIILQITNLVCVFTNLNLVQVVLLEGCFFSVK